MENGVAENYLFEMSLLEDIDWSIGTASFAGDVSPTNPGAGFKLRPLAENDYDKDYMKLLSQLTNIGQVTNETFRSQFKAMQRCTGTYFVLVLEDLNKNVIIGSATLVIEQKFIHSAGKRGRIEDVIVNGEYRGKQFGKLLVQTLTLLGKNLHCYKLSLECKEENVKFYENFGYKSDGQLFMVQRYLD